MRHPLLPVLLAAALVAGAASCDSPTGGGDGPVVTALTVEPQRDTLAPAESITLRAAAMGDDGVAVANPVLTWVSSDTLVATVTFQGIVTGRTAGVADVTAHADGARATARIWVVPAPPRVEAVEVTPGAPALQAGATLQLTAVARDGANEPVPGAAVAWSALDPAVATVSGTGLVTGVAPGSGRIVASSGSYADTVTATVTAAPPPPPPAVARVEVTSGSPVLQVGQTAQLTAQAYDAAGQPMASAPIAWATLHPAIASVSATGLVQALAAGSASIVASSGGRADTVTVTVSPPPAFTVETRGTKGLDCRCEVKVQLLGYIAPPPGLPTQWWFEYSTSPDLANAQTTQSHPRQAGVAAPVESEPIAPPPGRYYYRLVAQNGTRIERGEIRSALIAAPPTGSVSARLLSPTQVEVTWTHTGEGEPSQFRIEYSPYGATNEGSWVSAMPWHTRASGVDTFPVYGGQSVRNAAFRLRSCNYVTCVASPPALVSVPALAPPGGLAATSPGPNSVQLTWADNAVGESGYLVFRGEPGFPLVRLDSLGPGATAYLDNTVQPGTWNYRVITRSPEGQSLPADVQITLAGTATGRAEVVSLRGLTRRGCCKGDAVADMQFVAYLDGFVRTHGRQTTVVFEVDSDASFASPLRSAPIAAGTAAGNVQAFTTMGVFRYGERYYYRMIAQNSAGADTSETGTEVALPPPPATLSVEYLPNNQHRVSWVHSGGGDVFTFAFQHSSNGTSWSKWFNFTELTGSYTVNAVSGAVDYYRVMGCNDVDCSFSAPLTVTQP